MRKVSTDTKQNTETVLHHQEVYCTRPHSSWLCNPISVSFVNELWNTVKQFPQIFFPVLIISSINKNFNHMNRIYRVGLVWNGWVHIIDVLTISVWELWVYSPSTVYNWIYICHEHICWVYTLQWKKKVFIIKLKKKKNLDQNLLISKVFKFKQCILSLLQKSSTFEISF